MLLSTSHTCFVTLVFCASQDCIGTKRYSYIGWRGRLDKSAGSQGDDSGSDGTRSSLKVQEGAKVLVVDINKAT